MKSWLLKAREASNLTPEDCASAMKCSRNTYLSRENNPGTLSIIELNALHGVFNEKARLILWAALQDFRA